MDKQYALGKPEDVRVCKQCADYLSPMNVDVVITHAGCMDGILSAVLLVENRIAKPFVFYVHPGAVLPQHMIEECTNRRVLMVDVAPSRRDYDHLETVCARFAVLDHHKANLCYRHKASFFYVETLCGASAMYYYVSTRVPIRDPLTLQVIDNIHQHDLWSFTGTEIEKKAIKRWTRALQTTMHKHPDKYALVRSVCVDKRAYRDIVEKGNCLAPIVEKTITSLKKKARVRVVYETRVLVVDITHDPNARLAINECGSDLSAEMGLPVCFVRVINGSYCVSCRGQGALEFAQKFPKGGGHQEAAGFQLSIRKGGVDLFE